mgnify:CR=1 FL=1
MHNCYSLLQNNKNYNNYEKLNVPSKESVSCKCDLNDIEVIKERAVTGVAVLEEMKEQLEISAQLIQKYIPQASLYKKNFFPKQLRHYNK